MANVISICKQLEELQTATTTSEELLQRVLDLLQTQAGIRGYFCKIWGKRWSFWLGDDQLAFTSERIMLNPQLGFCCELDDQAMTPDEWQMLRQCLQTRLSKLNID